MSDNDFQNFSRLLDEKLTPIHKELKEHGKLLQSHGKLLQSHSKLLKSLKKDQDTMLDMLDREQMQQRKRLKRVEEHLELTSSTP